MALQAVRSIMQRESKETLTDWRILTPIFVLAFLVPQVLIAGADVAINFIGREAAVQLVPFAMMLVGFIPASFSLITALESFVGERERNSLEALLAMPLSDRDLYLGKLSASLLPPLLSSLLAMAIFVLTLRIREPDLFMIGLNLTKISLVVLLIFTKALVMVAGAVIISSHTTSIRAANLLASFVLLPTTAIIQIEALLMIGQRWDVLGMVVLVLAVLTIALARTGMAAFNREEILSREHEQLRIDRIWGDFRRFLAEYQPPGVVPADYPGHPFSPWRFYRHELPAIMHEYRVPLWIATGAAVTGALLGSYIGNTWNVPFTAQIMNEIGQAAHPGPQLALFVFLNNLRVALLSSLLSLFAFGMFAFLVPASVFAQIGFITGKLVEQGGSWLAMGPDSPLQFVVAYLLPHGVIEIPTALLSAALGLRIGVAILSIVPGFSVGQHVLWALAQFAKVYVLVLVPLFLVAALIEGFVTPWVVRALY